MSYDKGMKAEGAALALTANTLNTLRGRFDARYSNSGIFLVLRLDFFRLYMHPGGKNGCHSSLCVLDMCADSSSS